MLSQEELAALDHLIWLRSGQRAAAAIHCNQSTVSRRITRATALFGLTLEREAGEWQEVGPQLLLALEREVHQLARFLGEQPLRLEVAPYLAHLLAAPPPPGWVCGPMDHVGILRPLDLLRSRVIDAWLCDVGQDLHQLGEAAADLEVIPLFHFPVLLAALPSHPLVGCGRLGVEDLRRFPLPALSPHAFPWAAPSLRAQGLGEEGRWPSHYTPADWEGLCADGASLSYATPFSRSLHPQLELLEAPPLLVNTGALVCRAELAGQGAIQALHAMVCARLRRLLPLLSQVEMRA